MAIRAAMNRETGWGDRQMKFGTSGLRGLSVDLTGKASALYAAAFGRHLLECGQARKGDLVFISQDYRESSPLIAANCAAALQSVGFRIGDCGSVPTPALALYAMGKRAGSLMVTGSHIPADRNGIKFYRPDGEIDKGDEVAISRIAAELEPTYTLPTAIEATDDHSADCSRLFLDRYKNMLGDKALGGLRVGVYQHSTVARDMLVELLVHYGAEVVPLGRSEVFIPVDTEAVSADTIELFRQWSADHRLDAVVSADGDGDRPLVADESGAPLRGDVLGLIAANFLQAQVLVTPVTSNSGIEDAGHFQVLRTRVGSPFVIAAMQEAVQAGKDGVIGFEANGGTLTMSTFVSNSVPLAPLPTRDCFLPILAALFTAARQSVRLSAVARSFSLPIAASDRLEAFPVDTSNRLMAHLRASFDNLAAFLAPIGKVAAVSDIDGLRVILDDGRIIHIRPSGNAPELRCYVEAQDENTAALLLKAGLERLRYWADTNSSGS